MAKDNVSISTRTSASSNKEGAHDVDVVVLDSDGEIEGVEKVTIVPKKRRKKHTTNSAKTKNKSKICPHCHKSPCEWNVFGPRILSKATREYGRRFGEPKNDNDQRRYLLYQYFTYIKFGTLGKCNRKEIPWCVEGRIKNMYPSVDGVYTYFKSCS